MKFVFYLQNGIKVDALPEGYDKFYITEDLEISAGLSRYYSPGDDIQYSLDTLCVNLYDAFQDAIFPSQNVIAPLLDFISIFVLYILFLEWTEFI